MASQLPSSGGKLIPEYSTAEVNKWLTARNTDVVDWTTITLIVVGLIGFCLLIAGIVTYMKEQRESGGQASMSGKGGGLSPAITMIYIGAAFGAADGLFLLFVSLIRS